MSASLPIPNDDPACHCALVKDGVPEGAAVVAGAQPEVRVALHADCPHHGGIVRGLQGGMRGAFSIGPLRPERHRSPLQPSEVPRVTFVAPPAEQA